MTRDRDDTDFASAMQGVAPLGDRDRRLVSKPKPEARPRKTTDRPPPYFEIERQGEAVRAVARGVDSRKLRTLIRMPVERRVDLHGLFAQQAQQSTLEAVQKARASEQRCLLIIHGRGRNSPGGPVLKEALMSWLTEAPLGHWVQGFRSAPPDLGGVGATLVLLRPIKPDRNQKVD